MPTNSNIANDVISSQGNPPITGATKVSIKRARANAAAGAKNKLDASTLNLSTGATRVYVKGLADAGATTSTTGIVVTATIDGFGTGPTAGSTLTLGGATCKCTDVTGDDNVGELHKWSASYTSDYTTSS